MLYNSRHPDDNKKFNVIVISIIIYVNNWSKLLVHLRLSDSPENFKTEIKAHYLDKFPTDEVVWLGLVLCDMDRR